MSNINNDVTDDDFNRTLVHISASCETQGVRYRSIPLTVGILQRSPIQISKPIHSDSGIFTLNWITL